MIARRWIATCDAPGCGIIKILEGDQNDGRWELGIIISDDDWAASPAERETFCPQHKPTDGEQP